MSSNIAFETINFGDWQWNLVLLKHTKGLSHILDLNIDELQKMWFLYTYLES